MTKNKKPPLWLRTDIFFDGEDALGAKPRETLAVHADEQPKTRKKKVGNGDFFTVAELATKWNLSEDVIRKEFENEPGVLKLARARKGKRRYKTLRIPAEVARRVRRRMSA